MEVDKSWIHLSFPDEKFIKGVLEFVKFAKTNHRNKNVIACPCRDCKNQGPALDHRTVMLHCFQHGFDTRYKFWFIHGEKEGNDHYSTGRSRFEENPHDLNDAFNIVVDNFSPDNLDTMLSDDSSDDSDEMLDGENLIDDIEFNKNLREAMRELYPGCVAFNVLRFVVKLFNLKIAYGWTNQSFTELLQILEMVLPHGNKVPKNHYHADKIIRDLGLKYEKIDACKNDCILYWGKHKLKDRCPTCKESRYKEQSVAQMKKGVKSPAKILRYFPLTTRLRRLYSVEWVAKAMQWHKTGKLAHGKMRHPVDSAVWRHIDSKYKDFAGEPRNVRLGLATDGFNPFGALSTSYSSWPIMSVIYNLPPQLCMKPQFIMLTALVEGPRSPGKDIDVFMQPAIKELNKLWCKGQTVKDASDNGKEFKMRAVLLWTSHDFPAYGNISGCRTHGKYACPVCGPKTASLRLNHGRKFSFMRHRRWLPMSDEARYDTREGTYDKTREEDEQPIRLTGVEVDMMTQELETEWGKGKKSKPQVEHPNNLYFSKRSELFKLPYWKHIPVRHNLDVMHIEKNVCEILLAMMLNTSGKTKDDINARKDLEELKIKKRYWLSTDGERRTKPGIFCLEDDEKKMFFQILRNLKLPIGFSSNWSNLVKADSLDLKGLKSHDYHILMQHLLPMLIQHAYRDGFRKEARSIIRCICTFFGALCSRTLDIQVLTSLERGMVRTLCALERVCPPSLFVIMMHLPIHLAYEARMCGPVPFRWMYVFERKMKDYKFFVANKARPEGCIAERYLREETLIYCSGYRGGGGLLEKLDKIGEPGAPRLLDSFDGINDHSTTDEVGPVGASQMYFLEGVEYEQARSWVLKSHKSYDYWHMKYVQFLEDNRTSLRRAGKSFDFLTWLKAEAEFLESNDVDFKDIVRGPIPSAKSYNKYCTNGFLFVTKDYQMAKKNQNSGVSTKCLTTLRSSAKDKNPIDDYMDYYGVLRKIIEIEYREGYSTILFKCDWVKFSQNGIKMDEVANLRMVNLSNLSSSMHINDEPFIFGDEASQVFYSQDPKNPNWHVVVEVPRKIYSDQDEICLSTDHATRSDLDGMSESVLAALEDELIFNDTNDMFVVMEEKGKKKRTRGQ